MRDRRKIIRAVLFLAAGAVFLFSALMLGRYQAQAHASQSVTDAAIESAVTIAPSTPEEAPVEADIPREEPSEEPPAVETAPIEVDFETLLAQNPDVIGWIYCPDTPLNYPVVQAGDNSYYLRRLLDGQWNSAGTLFLDFRNDAALSDPLSVIYGHNMKNDAMFGCLPQYRDQSYYDEHPIIWFLTPERTWRLEILAGFAAAGDEGIYAVPASPEEAGALVADAISRSDLTAEAEPGSEDRYLALSTCIYDSPDSRYIVLGALREIN